MTPRETAQSGIRSRSTKLTILDDITGLGLDNLSMVQVSIGVVSSAGGHQEHASVSLRERRLSPSASRIVLENHITLHHAVETTPVQAVESDSHPHNSTIFRCTPGHRQAREGFSSPGLSVKKQESFGYSSTSNRLSNCLLPFFQGLVPGRLLRLVTVQVGREGSHWKLEHISMAFRARTSAGKIAKIRAFTMSTTQNRGHRETFYRRPRMS